MKRLFYLPTVIAVIMILTASFGVYMTAREELLQSRQQSVASIAQGAAIMISSQLDLLNKTLDKMALDPEVSAAVIQADPVLINTVASKLEKHFPNIIKIRLLLPGSSFVDDKSEPRMGYADIDMVRETFTNQPLPGIQGDNGPERHLAITRRIMQNDKVIGVILASLNHDFIAESIKAASVTKGYIELKQGTLGLGDSGQKKAGLSESARIKVENTPWSVEYQYDPDIGLGNFVLIGCIIIIPILIITLISFIEYRKFSEILAHDLRSIVDAAKDMMERRVPGSYPVHLAEMQIVISKMLQYKRASFRSRASDTEEFDLKLLITDDKDFDLENFLNDPADFKTSRK